MKKIIISIFLLLAVVSARSVVPLSKTKFTVIDGKSSHTVNLKGREFIIVSVRERGSDGRYYAVDKDGVVWDSNPIASGADDFKTPSGIYDVKRKKRFYMSKKYPSDDGVDNMDWSIFFNNKGYALHQGSTGWLSHGCIHIDPKNIQTLYRWSHRGMPIIITRSSYMRYARKDLQKFNIR